MRKVRFRARLAALIAPSAAAPDAAVRGRTEASGGATADPLELQAASDRPATAASDKASDLLTMDDAA